MPDELEHSWWKNCIFQSISAAERFLRASRDKPFTPSGIKSFLFLQYDQPLGSILHATPLFEAIKKELPDTYISVAASKVSASVLKNNSFVNRCHITADPWEDFRGALHDLRQLYRELPSGGVCIVTTLGNQRSRLALMAMLAGRSYRIGFNLARSLYDAPLIPDWDRPQIESNLDILRRLGHVIQAPEPRVMFDKADMEYSAGWLKGFDPGCPRIVFVTQTSGGQLNQWSASRFQQVISHLSQHSNAVPIFPGTRDEAAAIEALREDLPNRGISLAGKTTIPELAAVLSQCDLAISLDTGTFHVARAVGLPGVVIAPAWQNPLEWLPVQHPQYRVLRGPSIEKAPPGYWIEEVSVEQVVDAAMELMAAYPADPMQRMEHLQRSLR